MRVPVEYGHFLHFRIVLLGVSSSHCHVIEVAETVNLTVDACMMAWWSDCCKTVLPLILHNVVYAYLHRLHCQSRSTRRVLVAVCLGIWVRYLPQRQPQVADVIEILLWMH